MDEIHRLNRQVEEVLYPAMEDYVIDIMIGKGRGTFHPLRSSSFYIGWSDNAGRDAYGAAAGSFWSCTKIGILHRRRVADDHHALGGCTWRGD